MKSKQKLNEMNNIRGGGVSDNGHNTQGPRFSNTTGKFYDRSASAPKNKNSNLQQQQQQFVNKNDDNNNKKGYIMASWL